MNRSRIVIFVEGADDERFFEKIIKPKLEPRIVEIRSYAHLNNSKMKRYVRSIKQIGAEFYFSADLDEMPCISSKKNLIFKKYPFIDRKCILIVKKEIESWYLAGLTDRRSKGFGIKPMENTECIGKEEFNRKILRKNQTRLTSMKEILDGYSYSEAMKRNASFRYVMQRLD